MSFVNKHVGVTGSKAKPHIFFYGGYWRVSLYPYKGAPLWRWQKAHGLVAKLNRQPCWHTREIHLIPPAL